MASEASSPDGGGPSTPSATAASAQSRGDSGAGEDTAGRARAADDLLEKLQGMSEQDLPFRFGAQLTAAAAPERYERRPGDPIYRPLKIYTTDPSGKRSEGSTAEINVPYEKLKRGPIGARFEVVANPDGPFGEYDSVDLEEPRLLIDNGHKPAPTDPVFHHQMVYAVAMNTLAVFRTALGREPSWGFGKPRLKLVPHASQEANACYSRARGSLEFGWFKVKPELAGKLPPNGLVYACLSHDIIAHELTHAILDGMRVRFDVATNPDVSAFHEAFADLVALLQRFSYRRVLRSNIIKTNGDLGKDSDLFKIAFELALGQGNTELREADIDATKQYDPSMEMHDLGLVLLSAVLDAFIDIYRRRSGPLIRMATGGLTAVPKDRALSYELMEELAKLASGLASQILNMCVRAIDYCPPVDMTLGEYLRALITADFDLVPDDPHGYRESMVAAFCKRKIYPPDVTALTEDALLWKVPGLAMKVDGLDFGQLRFSGDPGQVASKEEVLRQALLVGNLVTQPEHLTEFGLVAADDPALKRAGMMEADAVDPPVVESVRLARRVGPDGQLAFDVVAEISQRREVKGGGGYPTFDFYGGSTIIFGARGQVRYVITKSVTNNERLAAQRERAATDGVAVFELTQCRHQVR